MHKYEKIVYGLLAFGILIKLDINSFIYILGISAIVYIYKEKIHKNTNINNKELN